MIDENEANKIYNHSLHGDDDLAMVLAEIRKITTIDFSTDNEKIEIYREYKKGDFLSYTLYIFSYDGVKYGHCISMFCTENVPIGRSTSFNENYGFDELQLIDVNKTHQLTLVEFIDEVQQCTEIDKLNRDGYEMHKHLLEDN